MNIKQFVFNPFGVNCYILSNSNGEAILIDPSVSNAREQAALADYIKSENLKVRRNLNTHLHLDHVLGNAFVERTYGIKAEAHKDDTFLLEAQKEQSQLFGLPCNDLAPALGNYLNEGDIVEIAEIKLQVIHVAGHSPGGLAFFCENPGKVNGQDNVPPLLFPGDIIFAGSRGRSDLYGGDEFALVSGIKSKLLTLPAETVVFPGHGPSTTIGNEKMWY
ncbi:MAG: MBL fold metallo-hydrolase [Fibrobacter sp.]|uniref:MBL fold metallo-hydrolase n=1 Tax=Fibrobacter sp. TaxID=35828 RepID=UPI0025B88385|nr:MBL fold metallo-hydrolase [Fibrobacter sp.]MBQ7079107.1 MBL fold metallo-hydrolase [Fibrobacter sp.]